MRYSFALKVESTFCNILQESEIKTQSHSTKYIKRQPFLGPQDDSFFWSSPYSTTHICFVSSLFSTSVYWGQSYARYWEYHGGQEKYNPCHPKQTDQWVTRDAKREHTRDTWPKLRKAPWRNKYRSWNLNWLSLYLMQETVLDSEGWKQLWVSLTSW